MENSNNRWWETYLVRYISGTVIGAVIVYLLLKKIGMDLVSDFTDIKTNSLLVLSALGFAYCYIASAPITLLHAVRSMSLASASSEENPDIRFDWIFFIILLLATLFGYFLSSDDLFFSIAGGLSMFILTSFYWFAIKKYKKSDNNNEWQSWYMKLASKRALKQARVNEYVQSYRHLREHGNAFLIMVLEICFGILVYSIENRICVYFDESERQAWITVLFATLIYWIFAGAICWHLGNKLEKYLVNG